MFGDLVRRRRDDMGLQQLDVARLVYNDETKAARVSDVETGRYATLQASTVNSYAAALKISRVDIDACRRPPNSTSLQLASLADVRAALEEILRQRESSRSTMVAVESALNNIEHDAEREVGDEIHLRNVVFHFLESVGRSSTPTYLWPAILNELAFEIMEMRRHLTRRQNQPAEITKYHEIASNALGKGDYGAARNELEKVRAWNEREYLESRLNFEHSAINYVRTLAQIASLSLSQSDYADARKKYVEILGLAGVPPDQRTRYEHLATVSYSALINLAPDYDAARNVFDEMVAAQVKPNEVTYGTLINLAPGYDAARKIFDEMVAAQAKPNEVTVTTIIKKSSCFEAAVELVDFLASEKIFTGLGAYSAVFSKSITDIDAKQLLKIYAERPYQFGESLQSPLNQYRKAGKWNDAFRVSPEAPHTGAAQKFFREKYEICLPLFLSELEGGSDDDNLHYAFGIAACLNGDWLNAALHLKIALERSYHPKRTAYVNSLLRSIPFERRA